MHGIALPGAVNSQLYRIIGFSEWTGEPHFQWDLLGCLQGGESCDSSGCVGHSAPSCSSLTSTGTLWQDGLLPGFLW